MPERLFGIPSHPLMVHAPVVLLPLTAIVAIVLIARPSLLRHYGFPLIGLSVVSAFSAILAASSGEGLQDILKERSRAIEEHAEWGDRTRLIAIVFMLVVIAWVVVQRRWERGRAGGGAEASSTSAQARTNLARGALAALVVLFAVGSTWAVIETGHSGAKSAWEDAGKEP